MTNFKLVKDYGMIPMSEAEGYRCIHCGFYDRKQREHGCKKVNKIFLSLRLPDRKASSERG